MRPPFSFWSCPKRECAAPGGREKGAWARSGAVALRARRGSAYRCKRRFCLAFGHAMVFCDSPDCCPVAGVPTSSGVVIALTSSSFRCRWLVVDEGLSDGLMQQLLRPPRQRVAERNARKEKLVKCGFAPRLSLKPRRGNQLPSLHRIPPRPSKGHRKHAGTISRRPPCARRATAPERVQRFSLWTVQSRSRWRLCRLTDAACPLRVQPVSLLA